MIMSLIEKFNHALEASLGRKPTIMEYIKHIAVGIFDYFVFGATVTDHFELTMINKSISEKQNYMTWRWAKKFIFLADNAETIKKYRKDKIAMYMRLKKYLGRDILYLDSSTEAEKTDFIQRHSKFLYKPNNQSCGIGIKLLRSDDPIEVLNECFKLGGVFEEVLIQHHEMAKLSPSSVNTIRVFTLKIGSQIHYIGAALRIGNGKDVVDNYSAGGLVCALDLKDGQVMGLAENMYGRRFEMTYSGFKVLGFKVPKWNEALAFVEKVAKDFEVNYVGWDVAICEDGCKLIEANPRGMVNVIQIAGNGGKKRIYKELSDLLKNAHAIN